MAEDLSPNEPPAPAVLPDIEPIVGERRNAGERADDIAQPLGRLDSEVTELRSAVQRLDQRVARVEERLGEPDQELDKMALRTELIELGETAQAIKQRISEIDASL